MGAATDGTVAAVALVVTVVLTATFDVDCAEAAEAALVVSARVDLATDLVLVLDLDEDLALVRDLADPVAALPLSCASPVGVVDELPVWAPPLLLTTTPEPTSVLDDVDPDVGDVPDVPVTEDDPVAPAGPVVPVAPVAPVAPAVPVVPVVPVGSDVAPPAAPDVPPVEPEDVDPADALAELDDDELADPPAVSATATP
ncbi:hypothetical protein [Mycobacterium sp. HM-7]